jgi:hypothetical protein
MKHRRAWRRFAAAAAATLIASPAYALDPYYIQVDLNQNSTRDFEDGYSKVEDAIDALDFETLQGAGYDGQENFDVDMFLRGLVAEIAFPNSGALTTSGSGDLVFSVPGVFFNSGEDFVTFHASDPNAPTEAQRRETLDQLKDYLKKDKVASKALLTAFARKSPNDPLAGNPDSLFGQRMRADFNYGFTNKVSQIWACGSSAFNFTNDAPIQVAALGDTSDIFRDAQARANELQAQNELGFGLLASSTSAKVASPAGTALPGGTLKTTALTLPISYTAKLDSDPRKKIHFELPLSYVDSEGAKTYAIGMGLAYTQPLTDMWSLTPAAGVGASGSQDLGSAGGVGSFALTSAYTWRFSSMALSMGNSVGQYQSIGLKIGDYEAEAEVNNTVITNGFMLTGPNSLIAKNWVIEYSLIDTRIQGDEVYSDSSDEIGIAAGHISTEMGVIDSYTKIGISYLLADGADGDISSLRLNLAARF